MTMTMKQNLQPTTQRNTHPHNTTQPTTQPTTNSRFWLRGKSERCAKKLGMNEITNHHLPNDTLAWIVKSQAKSTHFTKSGQDDENIKETNDI